MEPQRHVNVALCVDHFMDLSINIKVIFLFPPLSMGCIWYCSSVSCGWTTILDTAREQGEKKQNLCSKSWITSLTVEQLTYLSFDQSPLKGTSRSITIENQALDVQWMNLSLGINHGTTFIIAFMPDLGGNYTSKNHK